VWGRGGEDLIESVNEEKSSKIRKNQDKEGPLLADREELEGEKRTILLRRRRGCPNWGECELCGNEKEGSAMQTDGKCFGITVSTRHCKEGVHYEKEKKKETYHQSRW